MPLNRRTVDDTAGKHIAQLQQYNRLLDKQKREIRLMHERIARKVAEDRKR